MICFETDFIVLWHYDFLFRGCVYRLFLRHLFDKETTKVLNSNGVFIPHGFSYHTKQIVDYFSYSAHIYAAPQRYTPSSLLYTDYFYYKSKEQNNKRKYIRAVYTLFIQYHIKKIQTRQD